MIIEDLIIKNADRLHWMKATYDININFIDKSIFNEFIYKWDWCCISANKQMSENFIEEYDQYIMWDVLCNDNCDCITGGVIDRYGEKMKAYLNLLISLEEMSDELIKKYWNQLDLIGIFLHNIFDKEFVIDNKDWLEPEVETCMEILFENIDEFYIINEADKEVLKNNLQEIKATIKDES